MEKKKICIIGAGPAGIQALKVRHSIYSIFYSVPVYFFLLF